MSELTYNEEIIPKVSVIMPTFNRAGELPRSIRSVLSQSFTDLELIIVDDASMDNTDEVVRSFEDARIRYIKLEKNVGGAEARNIGMRTAKAGIIAFQDSDDEWTCSKLEVCYAALNSNKKIGVVFSQFIQVSPIDCKLMPNGMYTFDSSNIYESLLWQNHVGTPTIVARRILIEQIDGFTQGMPRYQDWDLVLRLAQVTDIFFIKEPLLLSYVTPGSITHNEKAHRVALEAIYNAHFDKINHRKKLKSAWLHRIGDARVREGDKTGVIMLFQAVKHDFFNIRHVVKFLFSLSLNASAYKALVKFFKK